MGCVCVCRRSKCNVLGNMFSGGSSRSSDCVERGVLVHWVEAVGPAVGGSREGSAYMLFLIM